ncbi:MAG: RdgB/HAM1 family non-canonical purine NTP pyrophosphatase [Lachnospiraceae bacterium]|nr:RdgB/HAM1 family non-canonical purine NTP pyrophosphatase [Lachnospiraceae bacterium]
MKTLIFATGNKGKMDEIKEIYEGVNANILSMKEAGVATDVVEDGSTFEENALIKARAIAEVLKAKKANDKDNALFKDSDEIIVMADDSGLEVDYLNKEPGIYSARYLGEDTSYDIKNRAILDRLEGVPKEKRTARFVCAIAAVWNDGREEVVRGTIEGYIGYKPEGENGFGYDPIFYVDEYGCSTAALSREDKNNVSHRGNALRMMLKKL